MDKNFRDMCAIMAMQGKIAGMAGQSRDAAAIAAAAFDVADAMLAERERRDARSPMADLHNKINRGLG